MRLLTGSACSVSSDIDVLPVGPEGQTALIVSDMGANNAANTVTLTLDDQAAIQMSIFQAMTTRTFQPTTGASMV